jgi:hypothetical protein
VHILVYQAQDLDDVGQLSIQRLQLLCGPIGVTQLYDELLTPVGLHVTQFCNRGCATSDMGQTRLR